MKSEKLKVLLLCLIFLFVLQSFAQEQKDSLNAISSDTLRKIPNKAFAAGEILKFDVNYGFVTAGEAVIKISDVMHNGRKCFKVDFEVDSKPFFDWIYKVRDRYSTIIDAEGLFPWRFEQHIREGGYTRDFIADFDQVHHFAHTTEGSHPIPPYVHDMLSAFFFARVVDFSNYKPGEKLRLQNFYKDSTYELDVKYKGKQEIEVEAGTFNCIVVEPLAREGGLFKSEGKVNVWLTDDERRIPVQVSTKVIIGSIDAELIEYSGINGPIPSKIDD
ncbi:MAG: DUF3108 domain-containing protein [Ignavibacteriae bacterium]|nr:DUF3108 domain-containing protein [Ignavibacteriota bacterium]